MDERTPNSPGEAPRRRKKRSKFQIFKEAYLPYLILLLAVIVLLFLIIGAVRRNHSENAKPAETTATQDASNLAAQQAEEAAQLLEQAAVLAEQYDYDGAIAILDGFSGDSIGFPELASRREAYVQARSELVAWSDPSAVPNLSFQLLIADPSRAFVDEIYGDAYNRNYVTTDEFSKILQQLYDNGYILVRLTDLVETATAEDGTVTYSAATLYLPADKKPLVLTQCAVNYFTYMTDGDGDGKPDKDGDGFASRLIVDSATGKILNEMVDAQGNLVTGAFDLVPILDAFIEAHPDFSYWGARAVLAVTGYDGIFGYRTDADTLTTEGQAYYDEQVVGAKAIAAALKEEGYEMACYTYDHFGYGSESTARVQQDLDRWKQEVTPVLGEVDILVYPFGNEISDYSSTNDTYNALRAAGFRYFVGMDNELKSSAVVTSDYFRQTRRLVSGSRMAYSANLFSDLFDASTVLNDQRGTVPQG